MSERGDTEIVLAGKAGRQAWWDHLAGSRGQVKLVSGTPILVAGRFLQSRVLSKSDTGFQETDNWVSPVQVHMGKEVRTPLLE